MWSGGQQEAQPAAPVGDDVNITADVFGQTPTYLANNVNINSALADMKNALSVMPLMEKVALVQAQRIQPQLCDDEHMLQFLVSEKFSAPNAASKFARYWNDRYKLFGSDKFCASMTLKGALKDDSLALSRGYVQLLPNTDTAGRAVCYIDWSSHEPSVGYSEDSMHRVFWYMMHVAMEDPNVIQNGIVMLIYPQEARLDQFDTSLWNAISSSLRSSLPIPWRSTHIVHPNRFFSIIHPVFMSTLPKDVQDRVVVHSGTKMKVLANLLRYCLPWDKIPSEIGGCVEMDFEQWLSERMQKEVSGDNGGQKPAAIPTSSASASSIATLQAGGLGASANSMGLNSMLMNPDQAQSFCSDPMQNGQVGLANVNPFMMNLSSSSTNNASAGSDDKSSVVKGPKLIVKSGRKSDPRMDRAVQLKLDNPSLPLLDALRQGGFVFPNLSDTGTPQYAVVDSDNVKITQRKNQLLRRVRTAKKKVDS